MARDDFDAPRLFLDAAFSPGVAIALDRTQANYLQNVLRLEAGGIVLIFNGRDGEWRAALGGYRKHATLTPERRTRDQTIAPDLHYLFAPLKHARLDYMVQKAVEMGAARLSPVLTRRTQVQRVNGERMRLNAIEAAEQCGILHRPEIDEPLALERATAALEADRLLIFCDEEAARADPIEALRARAISKAAVLVGPEGGFDPAERKALLALPQTVAISLGPRILRADTAAVAALALAQAALRFG